jgi:hypothetical protein
MQHSEIRSKSETVLLFSKTNSQNDECDIFKLSEDGSFTRIAYTPDITNVYSNVYRTDITTPDEDCILCVLFKEEPIFIRVGEPTVKFMYFAKDENLELSFTQYSTSGDLLSTGELSELSNGFYFYEPSDLSLSILEVNNHPFLIKMPYLVVCLPPTNTNGHIADGYFADTGYNFFGFLGETNSYFDLGSGNWVDDVDSVAKASDLGKAVASKYSLEWADNTDPSWIGNYIKYIRTYNEETKRFMVYTPSVTPESNVNNFSLTTIDELDNHVVRGIQILLIQDLETIDEGSSGTIIDFREIT